MSSPNAAGCIALLLSGLKQKEITTSPYQLKQVIANTSKSIKDPFGVGLFQVKKAFDALVKAKDYIASLCFYKISIGKNHDRGIYLRNPYETSIIQEFQVDISPLFPNDIKANHLKVAFETHVQFEASHDWIVPVEFAVLNTSGRVLPIRVDCTKLSPGFHYGSVSAFDAARKDAGPLFQIPVTVCKPEPVDGTNSVIKYTYRLNSNDIVRKFIVVPQASNFAEIIFSYKGHEFPGLVQANLSQLNPQSRYQPFTREWNLGVLNSGVEGEVSTLTKYCSVVGGTSLELCISQFWKKTESTDIDVQIKFHSILVSTCSEIHGDFGTASSRGGDLLVASGAHEFTRFDITCPLRQETVAPKLKFTHLRQSLRSTSQEIKPLKERDVTPEGIQVHELVLSYTFTIPEDCELTFSIPRFSDAIYDALVYNVLALVYDNNKKPLLSVDCYKHKLDVQEGEYTIRLQLASTNLSFLNDLKATIVTIDRKLSKPLSPSLVKSIDGLGKSDKMVKSTRVEKGGHLVCWVGEIGSEDRPKGAKPNDLLVGTLDVTSLDISDKMFGVVYPLPSEFKPKPTIPDLVGTKEPVKDDEILIQEGIRDLEISWIKKIDDDDKIITYIKSLALKYASHLPLYKEIFAALASIGKKDGKKESIDFLQYRLQIATDIITQVDADKVATYFGMNQDLSSNNEKDTLLKKEMELKREVLGSAYQTRAEVFKVIYSLKSKGTDVSALLDVPVDQVLVQFEEHLSSFSSWIDGKPLDNTALVLLTCWLKSQKGYHATALNMLEKHMKSLKENEKGVLARKECVAVKMELIEKLDWSFWKEYEAKWKLVNYPPKGFTLF